jgi:hypothetical protein
VLDGRDRSRGPVGEPPHRQALLRRSSRKAIARIRGWRSTRR